MDTIEGERTEAAVTEIITDIQANTAPYIPVMTGELARSKYRITEKRVGGWYGEVGYGAEYALYVHEAPGALMEQNVSRGYDGRFGDVWDPAGEPLFLDKGVEETEKDAKSIIGREYDL